MAETIFVRKSFVAITGASRGFGKAIAVKFAQKLPSSSVFVLLARNVSDMEGVRNEMQALVKDLKVYVKAFDQGNMDQGVFNDIIQNIITEYKINIQDFQQAVIVHNAVSMGDVTKLATQMTQVSTVKSTFEINVSGMILLNAAFFQVFSDSSKSRLVVNVTSDNTTNADPSLSLYCSGTVLLRLIKSLFSTNVTQSCHL